MAVHITAMELGVYSNEIAASICSLQPVWRLLAWYTRLQLCSVHLRFVSFLFLFVPRYAFGAIPIHSQIWSSKASLGWAYRFLAVNLHGQFFSVHNKTEGNKTDPRWSVSFPGVNGPKPEVTEHQSGN